MEQRGKDSQHKIEEGIQKAECDGKMPNLKKLMVKVTHLAAAQIRASKQTSETTTKMGEKAARLLILPLSSVSQLKGGLHPQLCLH